MFLLGCGRSGTTITGTLLGAHPDVLRLNEPHTMWRSVYALAGAYHAGPDYAKSRLRAIAKDTTFKQALQIRAAFASRQGQSGKLQVLEKTPNNSYRVLWLNEIFPNATYIFLIRNGLDVAKSISRTASWKMDWYGGRDRKWHLLKEESVRQNWDTPINDDCYWVERGLIEWTLTVRATQQDLLAAIPTNRQLHVRYEDLVRAPSMFIERGHNFMRVPRHQRSIDRAVAQAKTKKHPPLELPAVIPPATAELLEELGYPTS